MTTTAHGHGAAVSVPQFAQLDFYWQTDGTSTWNPETLPGSGIQ
jgi:hypothetical protein